MMGADTEDYEDILVSVIMPAYNAEKTVAQAVKSVLGQTHRKLELIIIDDCSVDATVNTALKLADDDNRVRVFRNGTNSGVAVTRNQGVASAAGDWIAFIDSDDMWEPQKLEKQLRAISAYPQCSICFTGSAFIGEENQNYRFIMEVPPKITYSDLLKQNLISCSSVLVKKKTALKYPMKGDPMIHEDFAVWLCILQNEPYAIGINEPLLIYRLSKSGKSGNKLRAAQMQWRTYRCLNICTKETIRNFVIYILRSFRKYTAIQNSVQPQAKGGEKCPI